MWIWLDFSECKSDVTYVSRHFKNLLVTYIVKNPKPFFRAYIL